MGNFAENLNLGNRFRPPPKLSRPVTRTKSFKCADVQLDTLFCIVRIGYKNVEMIDKIKALVLSLVKSKIGLCNPK